MELLFDRYAASGRPTSEDDEEARMSPRKKQDREMMTREITILRSHIKDVKKILADSNEIEPEAMYRLFALPLHAVEALGRLRDDVLRWSVAEEVTGGLPYATTSMVDSYDRRNQNFMLAPLKVLLEDATIFRWTGLVPGYKQTVLERAMDLQLSAAVKAMLSYSNDECDKEMHAKSAPRLTTVQYAENHGDCK